MPDVTVSFTDAQWTRIIAASSYIKSGPGLSGDVDATFLATKFKDQISAEVKEYERREANISDF